MKIKSQSFEQEIIPKKYTCEGEGISPSLEFLDIPEEAKSLVLLMEDFERQDGKRTYWSVWNINPADTMFLEGITPEEAIEGTNFEGKIGYLPPCPLAGKNRYVFRLFAVANIIMLTEGATRYQLDQELKGYVLETAELICFYDKEEGRND